MNVGDLIAKLRDYPRDMEIVLTRVFDGEVDGTVYDLDKIRMKEIASDDDGTRIATSVDFDNDSDVTLAVVMFPEK